MNVRFVRGGEVKPSNIGIGKYKGLLGLPREMQEVVLLLRKLGYFSEENEEQLQTGRFDNEDIRNFFLKGAYWVNIENTVDQFIIGDPDKNAETLAATMFISRLRAASEAQAICGVNMQFGAAKSGLSARIGS